MAMNNFRNAGHDGRLQAALRSARNLLLALLPLMIVTAAAGLFSPALYAGLVPPHLIPESQGQDAVTLFLAAPLLLLTLRWLRRDDVRGAIVAVGVLAYTTYVYLIYAYGGVVNWLFPAYVACLGLSVYGLAAVLLAGEPARLSEELVDRSPRRTVAIFNWLIAGILAPLWAALAFMGIQAGKPSEANLIIVTDLALVIPALALSGVWLWQRRRWGVFLGAAMLVFLVVLMLSIAAGQALKIVQGFTPQWGLIGLFGVMALGALTLAVPMFHALAEETAERGDKVTRDWVTR